MPRSPIGSRAVVRSQESRVSCADASESHLYPDKRFNTCDECCMRMPMNLDLRIDELVLHGVASADREQLAAAIAQALTQLFEQRGVPLGLARRGDMDRLGGHAFSMQP